MDLARPAECTIPRLRGMLHAVACPLVVLVGMSAAYAADSQRGAAALLVMTAGYAAIFGTSSIYHRVRWSPRTRRRVRQLDHSMIFVGMAMTYTALWIGVLDGRLADVVLVYVWGGATLGVLGKCFYLDARPARHSIAYVTFGMGGVVMIPGLLERMGGSGTALLLAGALAFLVGSIAFAMGRPNPFPGLLGHHEVFHLATIVGAALHLVALTAFVLR